jgi:hypothetical protein
MLKITLELDTTFTLQDDGDLVVEILQDTSSPGQPCTDSLASVKLSFDRIYSRTLNIDAEDQEYVDDLRTKVAGRMRAFADKIDPPNARSTKS